MELSLNGESLHAQEVENRLTINSKIYQMGGDYTSLKIDQGPSLEVKDHYFRAVLHQFTSVVISGIIVVVVWA